MKARSVADATILSLGAILESLPPKVQRDAARLAKASLDCGLADDAQAQKIVRGLFLLDAAD